MTHVLIGANDDEHWAAIRDGLWNGKPVKWRAVAKGCHPDDKVLIFLDGEGGGFSARAQISALPVPHPSRTRQYTGEVEITEILRKPVPIEFIRTHFPSWKWPDAFRRRFTTIDDGKQHHLECILNKYQESLGAFPLEGAAKQSLATSHDRNLKTRRWCIDLYGTDCHACGFSFSRTYGEIAEGFIHVHHLTPVSRRGGQYQVDPLSDLRPLCANCHAVVHRQDPPLSISELQDLIENSR